MGEVTKVRKVDLNPDEFLVGIAGLSAAEAGVYLVCNLLQYSSGQPIPYDDKRLLAVLRDKPTYLKKVVARLVAVGKLKSSGTQVYTNRASSEIEAAVNRISSAVQNGAKGGRPRTGSVKNQGLEKPEAFSGEKLSLTTTTTTTSNTSGTDTFEGFWKVYPLKSGEAQALKEWDTAITKVHPGIIVKAAGAYARAREGEDPVFTKKAANWLREELWADFRAVSGESGTHDPLPPEGLKGWRLAFWKAEGPTAYASWLHPAELIITGTSATLIYPTRFMADWVKNHYAARLLKFLKIEDKAITKLLIEVTAEN